MSTDPLSFFAGDASSSSSEDEASDAEDQEKEAEPQLDETGDRLPSPRTMFATVGRPSFLDNPLENQLDWDKLARVAEEDSEHQSGGWYSAVPPPSELNGSSDVSVSAAPLKYDVEKGETEEEASTAAASGVKRALSADEEEGEKKPKVETFRQKEKRKRDMGLSSRGKNYVEEEKRILRQQFGHDSV